MTCKPEICENRKCALMDTTYENHCGALENVERKVIGKNGFKVIYAPCAFYTKKKEWRDDLE